MADWEATWEGSRQIQDLFPAFHLEYKVNLENRGNVKNQTETVTWTFQRRKGKNRRKESEKDIKEINIIIDLAKVDIKGKKENYSTGI